MTRRPSGRTAPPHRGTIGIVAGSGPDAGIDLWAKVLAAARARFGSAYRGDIDAPRVVVVSEPSLGASIDLPDADAEVAAALEISARDIAGRCDVYAIACNTLNVYADRVRALELPAELVSFQDAVADWVVSSGVEEIGLLGARSVIELGEWSPYRGLAETVDIVTPASPDPIHELIEAIKIDGGADPVHQERLCGIVESLETNHVVLACTELPLVAGPIEEVELLDVTALVADALVAALGAV